MRTTLVLLALLAVGALPACAKRPVPDPALRPQVDLSTPPDVEAAPADATTTHSGLAYKVLRPGTGTQHPTATDTVRVDYSAWTADDGALFDSSVQRGDPMAFPLDGVIPGWSEGLQLMVVGEKARFCIPAELAYGVSPPKGVPAGMLVFDVELLAIE